MAFPESTAEIVGEIEPRHFLHGKHRKIIRAILDTFKAGEVTEPVAIIHRLGDAPDLHDLVQELEASIGSAANVQHHAQKVRGAADKRALVQLLDTHKGAMKIIPRDTTGNVGGFLMAGDGTVNGHPCLVSNTLPDDGTKGDGTDLSTMIFGAWSSLIVAMWGGLDLEADKVTLGERGGIVLRGFQDVDLKLRHPGAFTVVDDIAA